MQEQQTFQQDQVEGNPFDGTIYRLCNDWFNHIPYMADRPIKYLEIGAFYGANLISVSRNYAAHPMSELHCIDPWCDYAEYKNDSSSDKTGSVYESFRRNLSVCGEAHRINVYRGFSHDVIPTLKNDHFDLIYVDGNHEPEYVMEDCVIAFRKLKVGGYMVIDDYLDSMCEGETKMSIDAFLTGYKNRIKNLGTGVGQLFLQKT